MKIAIASDIHGSLPAARAFLNEAERLGADKIVLLGDLYYHGVRNLLPEGYAPREVAELLNEKREKLLVIKGNCDSDVDRLVSCFDFAESGVLFLGGKTVFLTHGDHYDEKHLPAGKYDILLYGHFHTGFIKEKDGLIVANPGSVSLPKNDTEKSFLILTDDRIYLLSLDGKILDGRLL